MLEDSTMRKIMQPCFEQAGFQLKILFKTFMNHVLCKMVRKNLCCTIIPQSRVANDKEAAWFFLTSDPNWEIAMVYNKKIRPARRDSLSSVRLSFMEKI